MRKKTAQRASANADAVAVTASTSERLFNRELSQLAFNERVLAMAARDDVPLAERLRYVCIVSSNLDEFFEVRLSDLIDEMREAQLWPQSWENSALGRSFAHISERAHALVQQQYALFNQTIVPLLAQHHIVLLHHAERNAAQRKWVAHYFEREVRPLLAPIGLDPSHPFPQVMNKALNFIVQLEGKDAFGRNQGVSILKVPRVLPRVIALPDSLMPGRRAFVLLSSVIRAHLESLYPGRRITGFSQFRVTRDSDLWVDEREVRNLRQALQLELTQRHFGNAVRLEILRTCPAELEQLLREQFQLPNEAVYRVNGPVNLVRLNQWADALTEPECRWSAFHPIWPKKLSATGADLFAVIRAHDILLHHPFESFEPVIEFMRQAAFDPQVVAIRMTLYRTGTASVLVDLLIEAARRGKEVTVVVELKARFDEEANINLAERLEQVGVQVVYGVMGLKTHAKLMLVLRREEVAEKSTRAAKRAKPKKGASPAPMHLKYYAHLSTGNYHPGTAKLYTDFGMFTAQPEITADIERVFMHLTSLTKVQKLTHLWLAPFSLHKKIIAAIENETRIALSGKPARIVAKMNALVDEATINALYVASQAGVQIDLIVRGACQLRPGVPGLSENIRVRAIVGRFLEHHRILYFHDGGAEHVYLSSADWMGRNLFRRIEIAWPVLDAKLKQRVIDEGLKMYLQESVEAWRLEPDGQYHALEATAAQPSPGAQRVLLQRLVQGE